MAVRKRTWTTRSGEVKSAWLVEYRDGDGKRRFKTFEFKKDAVAHEQETGVQVRQGTHIPDNASVTVKKAAEIWLTAVENGRDGRPPAERATVTSYEQHVRMHIVPRLGAVKLSKLNGPTVAAFRDDLLANLSRPLARKVLASLKGVLGEAQTRGLVATNVASAVKIGSDKRRKQELKISTKAEIDTIIAKLDELATQPTPRNARAWRRWRAFVMTAIDTGMRSSELRGLPWSDVDLDIGTITVSQRADERGNIGPPKSSAGRRTIHIPDRLVRLLKEWKLESGQQELVFATGPGKPEQTTNIHKRCWQPLLRMVGMTGKFRFHDLRHFHAAMLIAVESNVKEVQTEMGHSTIQTTFDTYGSLFSDKDATQRRRERAERMAGFSGD